MDAKKIAELRKKIDRLRQKGGIKSSELETLAKRFRKVRHKRGSEPNWVDHEHPNLRPLSIPHHGKELNRFTVQSILDQLEGDLDALEDS